MQFHIDNDGRTATASGQARNGATGSVTVLDQPIAETTGAITHATVASGSLSATAEVHARTILARLDCDRMTAELVVDPARRGAQLRFTLDGVVYQHGFSHGQRWPPSQ